MASCPKCGKKLKLTDISQFCPACGVNMRFVNFEENFYKEAKLAELSQASMHVKVKRLKASFVGSKLTIARLIVMLLPLAALLVPAGSFGIGLPYKEKTFQFSILGAMNLMPGSADFNFIQEMTQSRMNGAAAQAFTKAFYAYAAIAVFGVLVLFCSLLCFISYKNMQKVNLVFSGLGFCTCAAAMILLLSFIKAANNSRMFSAKFGFGLIVCMVMFAAVFVVNLLLTVKGIPVQYDEGMVERAEIYKKVKAGEIDIDSLPQPVVETAETKKIDEEIAKEEASFKQKNTKEEDNNGSIESNA